MLVDSAGIVCGLKLKSLLFAQREPRGREPARLRGVTAYLKKELNKRANNMIRKDAQICT
jgi:hypothetical protein